MRTKCRVACFSERLKPLLTARDALPRQLNARIYFPPLPPHPLIPLCLRLSNLAPLASYPWASAFKPDKGLLLENQFQAEYVIDRRLFPSFSPSSVFGPSRSRLRSFSPNRKKSKQVYRDSRWRHWEFFCFVLSANRHHHSMTFVLKITNKMIECFYINC